MSTSLCNMGIEEVQAKVQISNERNTGHQNGTPMQLLPGM